MVGLHYFLKIKKINLTNQHQKPNQNLKNQQSGENIDNLLKQIESARKQLKSQELRLQDIQNKIIKRRLEQ